MKPPPPPGQARYRPRVAVDVVRTTVLDDRNGGAPADGIEGTCSDCGHKVRCVGRTDAAYRYLMLLMSRACPNKGGSMPRDNFYVEDR